MHLPSLNRHQSSAGSRPLKKVCVLWDKVDELSAAAVSTMLTLHSWKCANDEERTISCVCAHVCSRSLAEVCVCAFVLSLTGVSVSAGVQLCANVLTVRYQSVKGVVSMRIYRSCSSARYRRLTAQSTSFGVFVSCLWSDISLCQQEMDNIPSTGSVRWSCAVWVDFPHRFLITSANVSVFFPRSTCR